MPGDDFWGDGANRTPRRSADTSSPLRWRNLFGFLHFSTRPANELLHQPRRLNAGLFPVGKYRRPVDVAPARDEDRYGIAPESDAEAAAAMQRTSGNNADSSTAQGQAIAQAQGSQGQPMQTHDLASGTGETSYEVSCCGFVVSARRRGRP
ncbi:hypothetical protein DFH29DRAFT_879372 [Suillus ampliporus]|nr:hypothetical protein DFH29DRAFT_879372 [Suillus ampliporus]